MLFTELSISLKKNVSSKNLIDMLFVETNGHLHLYMGNIDFRLSLYFYNFIERKIIEKTTIFNIFKSLKIKKQMKSKRF